MNTPTTNLLDLIRDDAHAAGFQSLGQYRNALLEAATAAATITIGETHSPVKVRLGLRLIGGEEVAIITLTQHDKTVTLYVADQAHAAQIAAAIQGHPPLAAPAAQGEPVATIHVDGSFVHVAWRISAPSRCAMDVYTAPQPAEQQPISHDWDDQDKCRRCGDRDWYASATCTPKKQPAPDVTQLVEALRRIADLPIGPCSTENDYRLSAAKAYAAGVLAAYRKQGGEA